MITLRTLYRIKRVKESAIPNEIFTLEA